MNKNNRLLWKYAGMATQFCVAIAIAVFGGMQVDKWLKTGMPLAVWILPLLFIIGIIYKIIKDTSTK
jgi:hypothetical protein